MTIDEVRRKVADIETMKDDDEAAHSREDMLYLDVLKWIRSGRCEDPQHFAIEALKASEIAFQRWCT